MYNTSVLFSFTCLVCEHFYTVSLRNLVRYPSQEIVPTQYFKKMPGTDGIWEVRVKAGSNTFRLLGFFDGSNYVVLAHAFQKKTQKIPKQAIQLAEERKQDYFRRKEI